MTNRILEMVRDYETNLHRQQSSDDVLSFFSLLFDEEDSLQVKFQNRLHPADAHYVTGSELHHAVEMLKAKHSESGIQFCMNALPVVFLEKLDCLARMEAAGSAQFDRVLPALRDELSLSA